MGAYLFLPRLRFRWQGADYQVLESLPGRQVRVQNLDSLDSFKVQVDVLNQALFAGDLIIVPAAANGKSKALPRGDLSDYPDSEQVIVKYRLSVIRPLLGLAPQERTRAVVKARLAEVRASLPPEAVKTLRGAGSVRSVFRWIKDYHELGDDERGLLTNAGKRGGAGKARLEATVNDTILKVIDDLVYGPSLPKKEDPLSDDQPEPGSQRVDREKTTVDDVRDEVAVRLADLNKQRPPDQQLPMPSRATIARRMAEVDSVTRYGATHSKRETRRAFRQYRKADKPKIPLERVEIDNTPGDLIILDDEDDMPIGRFHETHALDIATGYPLGLYIGPELGYYAVQECLYRSILPKAGFKELYGLQHDWLAYGIPYNLITDNGREFISPSLDDAGLALGFTVTHTPVQTPEFKPGIERYLGSHSKMFLHKLPGTTFSNPTQRGDYDSTKQACMYLSEVEALMFKWTVDVYAQRPHRGLNNAIPARLWETALENGFMPRVPASAEELNILLGRVTYRTINHYGLEFKNIRYNTDELGLLRHQLKREQAKIKYHPGDLSCIYVCDPESDPRQPSYIRVPALDQEYTHGLSLWKHQVVLRYLRVQQIKPDIEALGRAKREIRAMVQAAKNDHRQRTRGKIARWESIPPSLQSQARSETNLVNAIGQADGMAADDDDQAEGTALPEAQALPATPTPTPTPTLPPMATDAPATPGDAAESVPAPVNDAKDAPTAVKPKRKSGSKPRPRRHPATPPLPGRPTPGPAAPVAAEPDNDEWGFSYDRPIGAADLTAPSNQ